MDLIIAETYEQLSEAAARELAGIIGAGRESVLGLATGSTPEGMYAQLVRMHRDEGLDFSKVRTFNLDEYTGLPPEHPQSYLAYMKRHLFDHVNIPPRQTYIPTCPDGDCRAACLAYDRAIEEAGGIDLQVLGIGVNGHIAFNEPGTYLEVNTHLVELAPETIKANSRFFDSLQDVPRKALTMGVGSIMRAERIMVLAAGRDKAAALRQAFCGRVSTDLPASILQLHRQVLVVADTEAASLLMHSG